MSIAIAPNEIAPAANKEGYHAPTGRSATDFTVVRRRKGSLLFCDPKTTRLALTGRADSHVLTPLSEVFWPRFSARLWVRKDQFATVAQYPLLAETDQMASAKPPDKVGTVAVNRTQTYEGPDP